VGMLIKRNNVWKGASTEIATPDPKPANTEIRLPAQVGQPTNKPVVMPIPPITESFLFSLRLLLAILRTETISDILNPTIAETAIERAKLTGIIKITKCSVRYVDSIGTYPGRLQHGVTATEGICVPSSLKEISGSYSSICDKNPKQIQYSTDDIIMILQYLISANVIIK
jgi:hypothetical protein